MTNEFTIFILVPKSYACFDFLNIWFVVLVCFTFYLILFVFSCMHSFNLLINFFIFYQWSCITKDIATIYCNKSFERVLRYDIRKDMQRMLETTIP